METYVTRVFNKSSFAKGPEKKLEIDEWLNGLTDRKATLANNMEIVGYVAIDSYVVITVRVWNGEK